jgi:hypothetical protein
VWRCPLPHTHEQLSPDPSHKQRPPLPPPQYHREFFQCDFDIAGSYPVMVPDAEVLKVVTEVLDGLGLGDYEVKLNHRRLLDAMLAIAGGRGWGAVGSHWAMGGGAGGHLALTAS